MALEPISTQQTQAPASAPTATSASQGESSGALTSDFDTFLKLLTAQLKNQDPLNPTEGTEFVAQLAQFSTVEQQIRANDALGRIESLLGGGDGLTDWLGAQVEAPVPLRFDGAPVALRYDADGGVTQSTLIVKTESGLEVARQQLAPGEPRIEWSGALTTGARAPDGVYRFSVEERTGDGAIVSKPASGFATVVEARLENGGVSLIFEGGGQANAADVTAARAP